MASNLKGWIGFAIIAVIIIGGAFGTSHILKTSNAATTVQGITATGINGYFQGSNQTFIANVTQSTTNVSFSISFALVAASGPLNITVVAPSIVNSSAYNATFTAFYNKIYNESVNNTISSGGTLNATVNASLAENATRLASLYANQNLTYSLFQSVSKDVTYTGGAYTYNLTLSLNSTAIKLMKSGEILTAVVNGATGADSAIASIQFTKV